MTGQRWSVAAEGGFMYSDELSDTLRIQVQPLTKFRQLCDAQDGSKKGLNRGDKYNWNVYSTIDKTLKDDARKYFDSEAFLQIKNTLLRFAPTGGNEPALITVDTGGVCS